MLALANTESKDSNGLEESVEEMETREYFGYPQWRKTGYVG